MKKAGFAIAAAILFSVTAATASEILVPNRLATAKVGEWASYSVPDNYVQKLTVVKREGEGPAALVTIRVDNIYNDEVVNSSEFTREAGEPMEPPRVPLDDPGIEVEIRQRTIQVAGKEMTAVVVEVEYDDDYYDEEDDVEWYVSAEIPVFGIVRRVDDDRVVFDLIEYGDGGV